VCDLKNTFEQRGCGLIIRAGTLEDVIRDAFKYIDQSHKAEIVGVWMIQDHGFEEQQEEAAVKRLVEASGREFRLFDDNKYLVEK
jgi:deoxyribodipyrimidine photo-lyase